MCVYCQSGVLATVHQVFLYLKTSEVTLHGQETDPAEIFAHTDENEYECLLMCHSVSF